MKYPRPMHDAASRLTDKEYRFIRKEFGITKKELLHLSEDILIELYLDYIYVNEIGEIIKPGFLTAHFLAVLKEHGMPTSDFMIFVTAVLHFYSLRESA